MLPNMCSRAAHERIHEKLKPFVCPECSTVFQTWSGERDSDRLAFWKGKEGTQYFECFQSFKVMSRRPAYTRPAFCQSHAAYASAKTLRTSRRPQCCNETSLPTSSSRTPSCFTSARAALKPSTPRLRYMRTGTNITATPALAGAIASRPTSPYYTRRPGCHPIREATSFPRGSRTRSGWGSSLENGSADSDLGAFLAAHCFPREKSLNRTTQHGVTCR